MGFIYVGEAAGARIMRYGIGYAQVGDAYQFDVETLPLRPAGEVGDVVFRTIDLLLRHTLGYDIDVTPIVDGVAQPAQSFNGGGPPGGLLQETKQIQTYVGVRGNVIAARVTSRTLLGETELVDVGVSFSVIRVTP